MDNAPNNNTMIEALSTCKLSLARHSIRYAKQFINSAI
jgi:hypothetical protein